MILFFSCWFKVAWVLLTSNYIFPCILLLCFHMLSNQTLTRLPIAASDRLPRCPLACVSELALLISPSLFPPITCILLADEHSGKTSLDCFSNFFKLLLLFMFCCLPCWSDYFPSDVNFFALHWLDFFQLLIIFVLCCLPWWFYFSCWCKVAWVLLTSNYMFHMHSSLTLSHVVQPDSHSLAYRRLWPLTTLSTRLRLGASLVDQPLSVSAHHLHSSRWWALW